jgi:inositol phosphorylceramide mannosyltransferase catalytic subunit
MRRGVVAFVVINVIFVAYLVFSVRTLLELLMVDGKQDAIHRVDLPDVDSDDQYRGKRRLIPKIIHQTYANASIPAHWKAAQQSCIDLHPDYEYKVGEEG